MQTIAILVGHGKGDAGGYDPGACAQGFEEFKLAREVARYAAEALGTYDCAVELINYGGNLNLPERIQYCNARNYSLIIECHLNAGKGTGCEVYHSISDANGEALAAAISAAISSVLDIPDRGARTKPISGTQLDYFGIIRETKPTALLLETCFIDTSDVFRVQDATGQKIAGQAVAKAVAQVARLQTQEEEKSKMNGILYIGDFTSKVEAGMISLFLERGGHTCEVVPYGEKWGVLVTALADGVTKAELKQALLNFGKIYSTDPKMKK